MNMKDTDTKQSLRLMNVLKHSELLVSQIARIALFMTSVLAGIWFTGRAVEAVTHNTVFDPAIIYGYALVVWIFLSLYLIGRLAIGIKRLITYRNHLTAIIFYVFFAVIIAGAIYAIEGYRIAVTGIFFGASGSTDMAGQSFFQLFKFHPGTPLLPINLLVMKTIGSALDIGSLMPFVWNLSLMFTFFIWSFAYGTLLLLLPGKRVPKIIHLCLALTGIIITMILKTSASPMHEELIFVHAATVIVLVYQILLTFSSLRFAALNQTPPPEDFDIVAPSTLKLAVFLLVMLPILADLQNQYTLSPDSKQIIIEMNNSDSVASFQYLTAAQISIHAGPATGDDIVGILPKGIQIRALEKKFGWIRIGDNRWIQPKYLAPVRLALKS